MMAPMMTPSSSSVTNDNNNNNNVSHKRLPRSASNAKNSNKSSSISDMIDEDSDLKMSNHDLHMDPNSTESPPPGVLNCLWYSRECVAHIWVVEKVLGWNSRPITKLRYADNDSKQRNDNDEDEEADDASMNSHGEPIEKKTTTEKKMSAEEVMLSEKEEWIQ